MKATSDKHRAARDAGFDLAKVLLVDDDPTSRLTLKTVLEAGGYRVDCAASAAEAVDKLGEREYELVLSDMQMESPQAGLKVLAHARIMDYKPAVALVTAQSNNETAGNGNRVLIRPLDIPDLLGKVADLIGARATRRVHRELKLAGIA